MADKQALPQWKQVYENLPKNIPDKDYDSIRDGFFHNALWPAMLAQGKAAPAQYATTYQAFTEQSERPDKSSSPHLKAAATSAAAAFLKPVASIVGQAAGKKEVLENLNKIEQEAGTEVQRQGGDPFLAQMAGSMVGAAPYFVGAEAMLPAGAMAEGLGIASGVGRATAVGGAGGAAYEGASAPAGERLDAAMHGAAVGAAIPAALGGAGKALGAFASKLKAQGAPAEVVAAADAAEQRMLPGNVQTPGMVRVPPGFEYGSAPGPRPPQWTAPREIAPPGEQPRFYSSPDGDAPLDLRNPPVGAAKPQLQAAPLPKSRRIEAPDTAGPVGPFEQPGRVGPQLQLERGPLRMGPITPEQPLPPLPPREVPVPAESPIIEMERVPTNEGARGIEGDAGLGGTGEVAEVYQPRVPVRPVAQGAEVVIKVPGETTQYKAVYAVRELDDVHASHNPFTFQPNEFYQLVNDRNYSDARNHGRIITNSANFDPEYLITKSLDATHGAPIITPEGDVLGGNSRTMILARAYRGNNPGAGDAYKRMLMSRARDFGVDPEVVLSMKNPVLVREIPTSEWDAMAEANGKDAGVLKRNAVTDLNKVGTAPLLSAERAMADARRVSDRTLKFIDDQLEATGQDATLNKVLEGNRGVEVVRHLLDDGIITESEFGSFVNERDMLTPFAKDRVSKLMLGRLFQSSEHLDQTPPSVRNRLERIAEPLARLKSRPDWDLTPIVQEALTVLDEARGKGIKNLGDLIAQQDMFGGKPPYSPEAVQVAKAIQANGERALGQMFREYAAAEVMSRPGLASESMFAPPTRDEAFASIFGDMKLNTGGRNGSGTAIPMREKPGTGLAGSTGGEPIPGAPAAASAATYPVAPGKAASVFTSANRDDVFHESIHRFIIEQGIGPEAEAVLSEVDPVMSGKLRNALPHQKLYSKTAHEETFVRLATAVRTGDEATIAKFVEADGTREDVMSFAVKQARQLQGELYKRVDSAERRIAERKLQEVVRRALRSTSELEAEASAAGHELKAQGGNYYFRESGQKGYRVIDSQEKLYDIFDEKVTPQGEEFIPSEATPPGVGLPPNGGPDSARYSTHNDPRPMPGAVGDRPLKSGWLGVSYWARPWLAWVQSVANKANMPELYTKFAKLQDQVGAMENYRGNWNERLQNILGKFKNDRMGDLFSYLEAVERDASAGPAAAQTFKLNDKELAAMAEVRTFLNDMGQEFNIDASMWIRDYLPRYRDSKWDPDFVSPNRKLPKEIDFFAEHERTGDLDAKDRNLYRVLYNYVRLGARKKFLDESFKEASDLINGKMRVQEGLSQFTSTERSIELIGNLKPYFKRHLEFVYGRPDHSYGIIQSAAQATLESVNEGIARVNKRLPRWMQMDPIAGDAGEMLNKMILLQYAGGLALRPMVHIRDATQLFMAYPMLGEKYFATGLKRAFSKGAHDEALKHGALFHDSEIMNLLGGGGTDVGKLGVVTDAAKKLLKPQGWTSNGTRLATFMGFQAKVADAAKEFRLTNDAGKFLRDSGYQWLDDQMAASFTDQISKATPDALDAIIGKSAAELTHLSQWDFKKGSQAGAYKYAAGRLFGQYGTWPTNYVEYMRRLATKGDTAERMKVAARFSVVHGAILAVGEQMGIDTAQWVFTQPLAYAGGPQFQAATSVLQAADFDSERGKQARSNLMKPGMLMIPGSTAFKNVWEAVSKDDPNLYMRILGFTPMTKEKETHSLHAISSALTGE